MLLDPRPIPSTPSRSSPIRYLPIPRIRTRWCRPALLLLPNQDLAIVRTRREDVSVFRMSPRDLPDGSSVAFERDTTGLALGFSVDDVEYFNGAVG
jgi:hypothetical protein